MEETIKLLKVEYLSNHCMDKGEIRGNLECGSAQPSLFSIKWSKIALIVHICGDLSLN